MIIGGALTAIAVEAQRAAEQEKAKARKGTGSNTKKQAAPTASPAPAGKTRSGTPPAPTATQRPAPGIEAKSAAPSQVTVAPAKQIDLFGGVPKRPVDPFGTVRHRPSAPQIEPRPAAGPMPALLPAWLMGASRDFIASTAAAGHTQSALSDAQIAALARDAYKSSELTGFQRQPGIGWDADVAASWIILEAARAVRADKAAPGYIFRLASDGGDGDNAQVFIFLKTAQTPAGSILFHLDYRTRAERAHPPYCDGGPLARLDYTLVHTVGGRIQRSVPGVSSSQPCAAVALNRFEPLRSMKILFGQR